MGSSITPIFLVERKGVEPSTFALRTRQPTVVSADEKELAATPKSACTKACTSKAQIVHGAVEAATTHAAGFDVDLAVVVEAWPLLPQAVQAGILAIVRASASCGR